MAILDTEPQSVILRMRQLDHRERIPRPPRDFGLTTSVPITSHQERSNFGHAFTYARFKILPLFHDQHAVDSWTASFCKHPVLFHTFHYTCAVHQDLVSSSLSHSSRPDILAHKGRALQHLRQLLEAPIDQHGMELVIHTMGLLATHDVDEGSMDAMYAAHPLPFDPPMPPPHDLWVYSRLDITGRHQDALHVMVRRIGGLQKLKMPGVAESASLVDLMQSSKLCKKPSFPSMWIAEGSLFKGLYPGNAPGRGFFVRISLPGQLTHLLMRLASLDRMYAAHEQSLLLSEAPNIWRVMQATHAVQHQLLSLPSWSELDEFDCRQTGESVYTMCRLAAVIYSNAVLLALPFHSGWHTKLASKLRSLLEESSFLSWDPSHADVLSWTLSIGALASFRSPNREWYELSLQQLLKRSYVSQRSKWESLLHEFLWSQRACEHGAAVLWQSIKPDRQ